MKSSPIPEVRQIRERTIARGTYLKLVNGDLSEDQLQRVVRNEAVIILMQTWAR